MEWRNWEELSRLLSALLMAWLTTVSICLAIFGAKSFRSFDHYSSFIIKEHFIIIPCVAIFLGFSFLVVLAYEVSAFTQNRWYGLTSNTLLLLCLSTVSFFGIIYGESLSHELKTELYNGLRISQKRFGEGSTFGVEFRQGWAQTQQRLHCCGLHNYTDWSGMKMKSQEQPEVPKSCCKEQTPDCIQLIDFDNATQAGKFIYLEGCYEKAVADISFDHIWKGFIFYTVIVIAKAVNCVFLAYRVQASNLESLMEYVVR